MSPSRRILWLSPQRPPSFGRLRARWLGPEDDEASDGSLDEAVETAPDRDRGDLLVLDAQAFPDHEALWRCRAGFVGPVMVLCGADEVPALLKRVRERDQLSLRSDPPLLLEHRIRRMLLSDPRRDRLTGLLHRNVWLETCRRAAEKKPLRIALLDLDHFKQVNDRYGHQVGDRILRATANRLREQLGDRFAVGRWGGEEFALWSHLPLDQVRARCEELLAALRSGGAAGYRITVSAGLASHRRGRRVKDTVDEADQALCAAKARGRDRVVSFEELEREAIATDRDVELTTFENRTRVLAEQVAEVINRRSRKLFEELKQRAEQDALTGLFSRGYFDQRLAAELRAPAEAHPACIALLDLDHFGRVNKEHGWPTGDKVLVDVARRIREQVREGDWVARYGGEELVIVMHGLPADRVHGVLERLREAVGARPFTGTDGQEIPITVSIGAVRVGDQEEVETLLERVSDHLLAAKRGGRNRVESDFREPD